MRLLVLVGAGGLAREVLAVVHAQGRHHDVLVVDDDPALWGTTLAGARVVGGLDVLAGPGACDVLVCAGRGSTRRALVRRLGELGVREHRFATLLHPSVEVPDGCTVGVGSILLAHVTLTADVAVGRHVVAMPQVTLTHDDTVADHATLCAGVSLGGHVAVGEAAYVGMNAAVREHLHLGAGSTLGMGSVLLEDLPAGETWAGAPARPLRLGAQVGA